MQATPANTVSNLQIIYFALLGGLVVLMVVIMTVLLQVRPEGFIGAKGPRLGDFPLITTVLCGIAAMNLLLALGLPGFITRNNIEQYTKTTSPMNVQVETWDTENTAWQEKLPAETMGRLLGYYQTEKIIVAAMCEAGGLCSAVAYLLEAQWVAVVLLFLCIAVMLWRVPTLDGVNRWLLTQVSRLH